MKQITGHLAEKNGKWYAVINLYAPDGRRKEKWHGLDLASTPGNKREANKRFAEVISKYNVGDLYLEESLTKAELERRRIGTLRVDEYMREWLNGHKSQVAITTYNAYDSLIGAHITAYFSKLGMSISEITGDEINDFYAFLYEQGLKGATAQRNHSLLHLAFKSAVKRRILQVNPCDQADRPRSTQYIASYFNAEDLKRLMDGLGGDPMRIPVILTAYYGLRRSEVLGIKWSAVDFAEKKISICHKIIEDGNELRGLDVMKTKSSYRTLPLIPFIEEILLAEREKQAEMQTVLRGAYNKKYTDYVCVDAIGNLISPQYITTHFPIILNRLGMKKIRFHDLRHSCASLMLANGVPMKMIQDWLGHSNMSTTANIYSHVDSASKLALAQVIGAVLGKEKEQNHE
ncbi:MAG: site-specific integrase [Clostridia bacterium]|nr:site-specific integrase [Clostridia bacterium]